MDYADTLRKFEVFFGDNYYKNLVSAARDGNPVIIDFKDLEKFDPGLADEFLESPVDCLKAAKEAISSIDLGEEEPDKGMCVRVKNIPKDRAIEIRDIRSSHLKKFIGIEGLIKIASEVRPQVTQATFECEACGNKTIILQETENMTYPYICECGNRRNFKLIERKLVDIQMITVEETPETLEGGQQARKISIFLRDDLVDPLFQKKVVPGNKVIVNGVLNDTPLKTGRDKDTTIRDVYLDGNWLETIEYAFEDVEIKKEDEKKIKEFAKDPAIYEKLSASIAPSIYGFPEIKEAISLQMFSGVEKVRPDGVKTRGDMHMLLVGDPGSGKSQLLKYVAQLAPKGRYVVGKSASGAGVTAAAVRDEFTGGWALEAGALVLANGGLAAIDEIDKMGEQDRSAMHEAMEQQSYHPDTELMLADGSTVKIGEFVDELMKKRAPFKGKDCEILPVDDVFLQSTDFSRIMPVKIDRVSRHKAPDTFIRIDYAHGRSVMVTPEHPVFVFRKRAIREVRADEVTEGELVPVPAVYNFNKNPKVGLRIPAGDYHPNRKKVFMPGELTSGLARLLGYVASEGYVYENKSNRLAEVGVSNTNEGIVCDVSGLFRKVFGAEPLTRTRKAKGNARARKDLHTVSLLSRTVHKFMLENFPELNSRSFSKRMPNAIKKADKNIQREFLASFFKGDGFVDGNRFGFITASGGLAKDLQDALLTRRIWSYIASENRASGTYYKVVVSGTGSMELFSREIAEPDDPRINNIRSLCEKSKNKRNYRDPIPHELAGSLNGLLKDFRLSNGYFVNTLSRGNNTNRMTFDGYLSAVESRFPECAKAIAAGNQKDTRKALAMPVKEIARELGVSGATVYNWEQHNHRKHAVLSECVDRIAKEKFSRMKAEAKRLRSFVDADIRFVRVKKISGIRNDETKWVYDVTVEPTRTFVSEGLVLHNTVTISKANIQATLRCKTIILAASNPKFGRFDPQGESIVSQINIPDTLLSRFDLIFPIRDIPNREKDSALAAHILRLHGSPEDQNPPISRDLLRKYIAYARKNCHPKLTNEATELIHKFYVDIRSQAAGDDKASVPLTARQLEALVRIAEASAKVRLSDKVEKKDAQRAVKLLTYCLQQVGVDPTTGKIDIDRLSSSTTSSQRNKIREILGFIEEMQKESGEKYVLIEDLLARCEDEGIKKTDAEEIIEKLKREGELFEPKHGMIAKP